MLVARLVDAVNNNVPVAAAPVVREAHLNHLDVTAEWKMLTRNDTPVPEPINVD